MVYAGFWRRTPALIFDAVLLSAVNFSLMSLAIKTTWAPWLLLAPLGFMGLFYEIYCHKRWGMTLGKKLTGVQVVSLSGEPLSWTQAVLRSGVNAVAVAVLVASEYHALYHLKDAQGLGLMAYMMKLGASMPPWVLWVQNIWVWSEVITLLFNKKKRALHDFMAGTVVVRPGLAAEEGAPAPKMGWFLKIILGAAACFGALLIGLFGFTYYYVKSGKHYERLLTMSSPRADLAPGVAIERPGDWTLRPTEGGGASLSNRRGVTVQVQAVPLKDLPAFEGEASAGNPSLAKAVADRKKAQMDDLFRQTKFGRLMKNVVVDVPWSFGAREVSGRAWGTCSQENGPSGTRLFFTPHEGDLILLEHGHAPPFPDELGKEVEDILASIHFSSRGRDGQNKGAAATPL